MKLIGSSTKGKHVVKKSDTARVSSSNGASAVSSSLGMPATPSAPRASDTSGKVAVSSAPRNSKTSDRSAPGRKKKMSGRKRAVVVTCTVLGVLILLLGATFAVVRWEIQPFYDIMFPRPDETRLANLRTPRPQVPDSDDPDNPNSSADAPVPLDSIDSDINDRPVEQTRNINRVTFLILGVDGFKGLRSEGGANTDVIMVATFDMDDYRMDIASIPRDTIVNVPWTVKKINSVWANMRAIHTGSPDAERLIMEDTKGYIADFVGFNFDYWVMLEMDAFIALVNAMPAGGVRYNVPHTIHLEEPTIGLNVTLNPGDQLLNGYQSLALIRYRGDGGGDFTRMENQHKFLKSAAEQILSRRDSINPLDLVNILLKYVKTDMDLQTMTRLGREMLKLNSDSIHFYSAPCTSYGKTGAGAGSYVYVNVDEWLEMVNENLNPFDEEITPQHVSILTLNENRRFYVTDDNWQGSQSWGG